MDHNNNGLENLFYFITEVLNIYIIILACIKKSLNILKKFNNY